MLAVLLAGGSSSAMLPVLGLLLSFITAQRYAKRGTCRRRVSVCIVSKRLNAGSRK